MGAYLFSGLVSQYFKGRFVDACTTALLYGAEQDAAWKAFEAALLSPSAEEDPTVPRKMERMVGAPVLEELLTENGNVPSDWENLAREALQIVESTAADDQGQGYWADCDQLVRPDELAPGVDWLQRELPEEIRSGLNWSSEKNYFFLITVLSPPAQSEESDTMDEADMLNEAESELQQRLLTFPQLADKELAVVVRARNSVIAAWLWRKYGAATRLARHAIRVDPLCEIVPVRA